MVTCLYSEHQDSTKGRDLSHKLSGLVSEEGLGAMLFFVQLACGLQCED